MIVSWELSRSSLDLKDMESTLKESKLTGDPELFERARHQVYRDIASEIVNTGSIMPLYEPSIQVLLHELKSIRTPLDEKVIRRIQAGEAAVRAASKDLADWYAQLESNWRLRANLKGNTSDRCQTLCRCVELLALLYRWMDRPNSMFQLYGGCGSNELIDFSDREMAAIKA